MGHLNPSDAASMNHSPSCKKYIDPILSIGKNYGMEFRQLHYFARVVEEGSFTAAARRCAVAQPSLSLQIQKLEEELGEPLLLRRPRGVSVTESGAQVYERALSLLKEREALADAFRQREAKQIGEVTLGVIPTIAPYLLGQLLVRFREEFPRIQIRVREAQTDELIRMVVEESVDFAVLSDVATAEKNRYSLYVKTIFREPILLAVPQGHPLTRHHGAVPLNQVPRDELLLLNQGHCFRDQVLQVCHAQDGKELFQCEQLPTLQALVAAGLGIAFVPEMFVAERPAARIVYLRLHKPEPQRAINLMKRRGKKLRSPAESLMKRITALAR